MGLNPRVDETDDEKEEPPILNPEDPTTMTSLVKPDDKASKFLKDNDVIDVVRQYSNNVHFSCREVQNLLCKQKLQMFNESTWKYIMVSVRKP